MPRPFPISNHPAVCLIPSSWEDDSHYERVSRWMSAQLRYCLHEFHDWIDCQGFVPLDLLKSKTYHYELNDLLYVAGSSNSKKGRRFEVQWRDDEGYYIRATFQGKRHQRTRDWYHTGYTNSQQWSNRNYNPCSVARPLQSQQCTDAALQPWANPEASNEENWESEDQDNSCKHVIDTDPLWRLLEFLSEAYFWLRGREEVPDVKTIKIFLARWNNLDDYEVAQRSPKLIYPDDPYQCECLNFIYEQIVAVQAQLADRRASLDLPVKSEAGFTIWEVNGYDDTWVMHWRQMKPLFYPLETWKPANSFHTNTTARTPQSLSEALW